MGIRCNPLLELGILEFVYLPAQFKAPIPDKIHGCILRNNRCSEGLARHDIFVGQILLINTHCDC